MVNGRNIVLCFFIMTLVGSHLALAQNDGRTLQNGLHQQTREYTPEQNKALADAVAIPIPTQPFELTKEETSYVEQVLDYWQQSSEKVQTLTCQFQRYEYDTEIVNYRDPADNRLAAASFAVGKISFAAPDRGYYETDRVLVFSAPPKEPGRDAEYVPATIKNENGDREEEYKEKWLSDGRFVYEYDFRNRILYEDEIPTEMRGTGIVNSPIPFLFGAKKSDILNRYWIRPVVSKNQGEYWLEAYPKRIEDARMYSKIDIYLDGQDFLPKAIHQYLPQYNPQKGNYQSRYFMLENRQVNSGLARLQDFMKIFVRPQTPPFAGWRRVERTALHAEQQAVLPHEKR